MQMFNADNQRLNKMMSFVIIYFGGFGHKKARRGAGLVFYKFKCV